MFLIQLCSQSSEPGKTLSGRNSTHRILSVLHSVGWTTFRQKHIRRNALNNINRPLLFNPVMQKPISHNQTALVKAFHPTLSLCSSSVNSLLASSIYCSLRSMPSRETLQIKNDKMQQSSEINVK